jgi:hypothetical protein
VSSGSRGSVQSYAAELVLRSCCQATTPEDLSDVIVTEEDHVAVEHLCDAIVRGLRPVTAVNPLVFGANGRARLSLIRM